MAAFDFPASPTVGQIYTANGVSYRWDGQAWVGGPAVDSTDFAQKYGQLCARENLLYNGDFTHSQKAGFAAVTTHGAYFADGFFLSAIPANVSVKVVGRQVSSGLLQKGRFRAQMTCVTAKVSLAATDFLGIVHHIEGLDLSPLSWGLVGGVPAVLRFGFKGPAGTYSAGLFDDTLSNLWSAPFTITAGQANQDTIQVFAIQPPPATGQWVTSNVKSASLRIGLAAGATYTGPMTVGGAWSTNNYVMPTGGFNFLSSTANVVELFDVKLVGDADALGIDPGFAPVDYATELTRCQRYYIGSLQFNLIIYGSAGMGAQSPIMWPTSMRTMPASIVRTAGTLTNASAPGLAPQGASSGVAVLTVTATGAAAAQNYIYDLDAQMT